MMDEKKMEQKPKDVEQEKPCGFYGGTFQGYKVTLVGVTLDTMLVGQLDPPDDLVVFDVCQNAKHVLKHRRNGDQTGPSHKIGLGGQASTDVLGGIVFPQGIGFQIDLDHVFQRIASDFVRQIVVAYLLQAA